MSKLGMLRKLSAEQPHPLSPQAVHKNFAQLTQSSLIEFLNRNAREHPDRVGYRAKIRGLWKEWNWAQARDEVGLATQFLSHAGVREGDKVCISGEADLRLYWYLLALQKVGAVAVIVHPSLLEDELAEVHSKSSFKFLIAGNADLVDAAIRMRNGGRRIDAIISLSPEVGLQKGVFVATSLKHHTGSSPRVDIDASNRPAGVVELAGYDDAGEPTMIAYADDNLQIAVTRLINQTEMTADDELVSFLPLAWEGEFLQFAAALCVGARISVVESTTTVFQDLRNLSPSFILAPASFYRSFLAHIEARIRRSTRLANWMHEKAKAERQQKQLGVFLDYLFRRPLRSATGVSRVRFLGSAQGFLPREMTERYRAFGVELRDLRTREFDEEKWDASQSVTDFDVAQALIRHGRRLRSSLLVRHLVFTQTSAGRWAVAINPDQEFVRACSSDAGAEYEQLISQSEIKAAFTDLVRSTNLAAAADSPYVLQLDGFYLFNPPLSAVERSLTRNGDVVFRTISNVSGKTGSSLWVPLSGSGA